MRCSGNSRVRALPALRRDRCTATNIDEGCYCRLAAGPRLRSRRCTDYMRAKLTALIALCAALASLAAAAYAGPVTVALYAFASQGDVLAFQKVLGAKCEKKWRQQKSMQLAVGAGTNGCAFRSSVVADSSDVRADAEIAATASIGGATPKKLLKKAFVGVAARSSENAGYELRVRPAAQSWQLFRDPKGDGEGPTLFRSGKGKFIRGRPKGQRSGAARLRLRQRRHQPLGAYQRQGRRLGHRHRQRPARRPADRRQHRDQGRGLGQPASSASSTTSQSRSQTPSRSALPLTPWVPPRWRSRAPRAPDRAWGEIGW